MKKRKSVMFSLLIVTTLLLTTLGTASAAPLKDGPTIYSSTDDSVIATILDVSELPGIVKLSGGAIYPVGHESGDLIFSGPGFKVSGLNGSAVIHMPVKNYTYGWTGSIYQYAFGGWIEVPSVITKDNESSNGTASATIYYDGIYALLVHYVAPVVNETGPACPLYESIAYYGVDLENQELALFAFIAEGDFSDLGLVNGDSVQFRVVSDNPGVTFSGDTTGEAWLWLGAEGDEVFAFMALMAFGMEEAPIIEFSGEGLPYFTITVKVGGCNFTYTANEDTFDTGGPY